METGHFSEDTKPIPQYDQATESFTLFVRANGGFPTEEVKKLENEPNSTFKIRPGYVIDTSRRVDDTAIHGKGIAGITIDRNGSTHLYQTWDQAIQYFDYKLTNDTTVNVYGDVMVERI